jgi:hypothetical protein
MKLDEAEIRLALDARDIRAAAGVILRHFSIDADLRRYVISSKEGVGISMMPSEPVLAIYFLEGGFALWSADDGFVRDETKYTYMFKGHIRLEESYGDNV